MALEAWPSNRRAVWHRPVLGATAREAARVWYRLGAAAGQGRASCMAARAPTCRSSSGAAGLLCALTEKGAEAAMFLEHVAVP